MATRRDLDVLERSIDERVRRVDERFIEVNRRLEGLHREFRSLQYALMSFSRDGRIGRGERGGSREAAQSFISAGAANPSRPVVQGRDRQTLGSPVA